MPHRIAQIGLDALQDAVHLYLCNLKTTPPIATGEQIGRALNIHYLGQPAKHSRSNPGWVTGAVLKLLFAAGRVRYVYIRGKKSRFYEAINCPANPNVIINKWIVP